MVDGTRTVRFSSARRTFAVLGVTVALAASALLAPSVASADTVPVNPTEQATVSSDGLPTVQINGVAWTQVIIGNTVYVGGDFTSARPYGSKAGVNETPRTNLLAYNLTTGELITSFNPTLNGAVLSMAKSPDGSRLYIGGAFNVVNGVSRSRVAAIDVATGTVVSTFKPVVNANVRALFVTDSTVYVGGDLTAVGGVARTRVAALGLDGSLSAWSPNLLGGNVRAIAVSPDGTRVAIGGAFTTANSSSNPGYGFTMVSSSGDGKTNLPAPVNSTLRTAGNNSAVYSLTSDGISSFFLTAYTFGSGGNFEGTAKVNWANATITWIEDCHGDTYSSYPTGNLVYVSGHPHDCVTVPGGFKNTTAHWSSLAFTGDIRGTLTKTPSGGYTNYAGWSAPALTNFFPQYLVGSYTGQGQATWTVTGSGAYVVYGGEFVEVNGKAQQGLTRYATKDIAPNLDGPTLSGDSIKPTLSIPGSNKVKLSWKSSWDRDNERLTYNILRNGVAVGSVQGNSRWYTLPTLTFTDTGLSGGTAYTYTIQAVDPFGNAVLSTPATITATGPVTNQPPIASFTSSTADLTATFDGTASSDPNGSITSWAWNFGDGATATGSTTSHAYAAAGTYNVTLTVTDNAATSTSLVKPVTVTAPPVQPGVIVSDLFTRAVTGGWGSAPTGGAWTVSGSAANYSVDGTRGILSNATAGGTTTAKLNGVSTTSADITFTMSVAQPITGATHFFSTIGRAVGTADYRANVNVYTSGAVVLALSRSGTTMVTGTIPGLTYTAGTVLNVRVQVTGVSPTTIQAKVWPAGSTEPAAWTQSTTDSTAGLQVAGVTGVSAYIGGAATGLPRTTYIDDLQVATVP